MECKTTKHLNYLISYIRSLVAAAEDKNSDDLMKLDYVQLKEIAATAEGKKAYDFLCLVQQLEKVAKTSRFIRQQCGVCHCIKDANSSTVEAESAESSNEIPIKPSKERKRFRVLMDMSNFVPKEVDVKVVEKYLVIHAKHETLADDHGTISREFTRKFEIPVDVNAETFRALVDCYGVLTVEASYKPVSVKDKTLGILTDPYGQTSLRPYEDLGQEFQELLRRQIEDGTNMKDFARNLAKHSPSDYIPLEEVI